MKNLKIRTMLILSFFVIILSNVLFTFLTEYLAGIAGYNQIILEGVSLLVQIAIAIILCINLTKNIMIPIKELSKASDALSRGEITYNISYSSKNET
jgi:methyl-accepting chemotaxis protein